MCRWLAYSGSPILLKRALYSPAHSLIDQSLHSQLGAEATNGDGFGVVATLSRLYPDRDVVFELSEAARLVVSEPVGDLPGAWNEVPESCCAVVGAGDDQMRPFVVKPPTKSVPVGV